MTLKKNSIIKKIKNFSINFWPQHPAAHGVLRLIFVLKREVILRAERLMGILHRGTEKFIKYKISVQALPYFNRQYYVSMMAQEYFYCLAISLLTGPMTLWLLVRDQPQSHIGLLKFISKMQIFPDAPHFWQIGFQDPASIPIEGVLLVLNNHIVFILCVLVPSGIWLLLIAFYYFVELQNNKNLKFVHSKKLEDVWRTAPTSLFFFLALTVAATDNWDISETLLEEVPVEQPAPTPINPFHRKTPINPYSATTQETVDKALLDELEQIFRFFKAKGFTVRRVLNVLYTVPDSFWSLSFWEKVATVEEHLQKEDAVKVIPPEISFLLGASFVLIFWVIFLRPGCGGG
jgi:Cytochrome C oxidase subunit II, transmembrane domain